MRSVRQADTLKQRKEMTEAERRDQIENLNNIIRAIKNCRKPVIAAVEGGAAGAGLSIAMACDMIVAGQTARFTLAYVKAGLVPDGAATYSLERHIGLLSALLAETKAVRG